MAHRDSKSQLVPLSLRGPAIIVGLIGFGALIVLTILSLARYVGDAPVIIAGVAAILAAILLALSWVDNKSPGALDNASGVVTLLALAARERGNGDVAFLLTDAEELGLVGARAIARRFPAVHGVINVDGIDDVGPFHVIERFGWPRPKGLAPHLAAALLGAAGALELPAQRRDAPFGILLDHMPIVRGGTPALSVMRGRLGSLMRVHRPGDDVSKLRGTGIEECVDLFAGALHLLRDSERARTG
jgi:Zn-dependent M28 family amino/carboxypeptidase